MPAANSALQSLMDIPACERDAKALEFIEEITKNADTVQKNVLAEILTQNADTEYLKSFNLDGATDRETFKSKTPVITYEDLKPLIQRIADGDRSTILSAHPINGFLRSSGTSAGEPKLIPVTEGYWGPRELGFSLLTPVINQYVKGLDQGKALYFRFIRHASKTRGGHVVQAVSTYTYSRMRSRNQDYDPHTSPHEAIMCEDYFQSMYTQMVCGLYERKQILRFGAAFACGLVRAIRFLQLNWQQLTHDIRTGSLNPKVTDASIRECMTGVMRRPNPKLADFIVEECEKDDWQGIITRIWPNAKYLDAIITGTMSQYISTLDYYSGGLPIVSSRFSSSECFIGVNLNPMCNPSKVSYTIMPCMAYFEFLPNDPNSHELTHQKLVDLVDVKIGEEYELVVTTYVGLCRYRMGDIIRITGFHNSAPQFQYVRRKNFLLSIDFEKTDEVELQVSVTNASQLLRKFNTSLVEYTSYADTTTIPGHYVIYWELLVPELAYLRNEKVIEQCCLAIEESLSSVYRRLRMMDKFIGPLEIRVVKNGTFEAVMNYAVSRGASIHQYKVPKCVSSKQILNILDSRVMSIHFSPSLPHWST